MEGHTTSPKKHLRLPYNFKQVAQVSKPSIGPLGKQPGELWLGVHTHSLHRPEGAPGNLSSSPGLERRAFGARQ